jgi:hypothetical protein
MSSTIPRPKKGLTAEAALKRWSNEPAYAELVALSGQSEPPSVEESHKFISDPVREREYKRKREGVEAAFKQKLLECEILASGISISREYREVMHPSIWELLEIDYYLFEDAVSEGRKYEKIEFFEPSAIPLNVRSLPDWLAEELAASGHDAFRHDPNYRHVWLKGVEFTLGPIHSKIVKLLHQAVLADDPWQNGKNILEQAGSEQTKMVDALKSRKDWKLLIASDGKGMYRLRTDPPGTGHSRS